MVITYTTQFAPHTIDVYVNNSHVGVPLLQTPSSPMTCNTSGALVVNLTPGSAYNIYGYSAVYNLYSSQFNFTAAQGTCHQVNLNF